LALDDVKKLIDAGKEKGYLAYNEVDDLFPNDVRSPEGLDDVLATIGTLGIDVLERQPTGLLQDYSAAPAPFTACLPVRSLGCSDLVRRGRRDDFAEPLRLPQTALQLATTARAPTEV
jgi:Sigma-70 factor, region 1.1